MANPEITPDFTKGDEVYVLRNNCIQIASVAEIHIKITNPNAEHPDGVFITYLLDVSSSLYSYKGTKVFKTKAGCAISWLKEQKLDSAMVMQAYLHEIKEV